MSYFSSDRAQSYVNTMKPFVDAVNAEGEGRLEIVPYFNGAITPVQAEQVVAVEDGRADIAIIVPSYTPERFSNTGVMELPGLFRDAAEATYVFRHLLDKGVLTGYQDFVVIAALASPPEVINTRKKTASLADLKRQTIRVSSLVEGNALSLLGATPVFLPLKATMESLAQGTIDGATIPPSMLFEFGVGRLTSQHYMLGTGSVPTALIMNRKKFESLPTDDQAIIAKYSGEWLDSLSAKSVSGKSKEIFTQISTDAHRTVISPSQTDLAQSQRVFDDVVEEWAKTQSGNEQLLALVRDEIAKYRTSK